VKNLLIIYPHWPPSNLVGVHRPRLIANYLQEFDWHPIVLTVSQEFYEEIQDSDIEKTVAENVEVIYTKAYKVTKPRVIGDIGLRAFPFLYKAALDIIKTRTIDFVWIPIPSFYTSLIGRLLHMKKAVPYGIDYIDPWVRDIHNRKTIRSQLSLQIAKWVEPVAVKKASLISGVSGAYYSSVLERNFKNKIIAHLAMPYGFDPRDHNVILDYPKFPWIGVKDCQPLVYAGAFLPNSHQFIKTLFNVIGQKVKQGRWDKKKHLYFIGTGAYAGTSIIDYAKQYGISSYVHELRERFPYLYVLNFLSSAYAVMAIGSTEKHYTASKIYQALLSKRPVFAIFHHESSAVSVMKECNAATFLTEYTPEATTAALEAKVAENMDLLLSSLVNWEPDLSKLEKYSAKASAKALVVKLNELV
jgi:hypothetical protein